MRTALILALLIHSFPSAIAADPPSDPRQYLDWWYRQFEAKDHTDFNPRKIAAWDKQRKQLESNALEERVAALKFLGDVAALSLADDAAGKSPKVSRFNFPDTYPRGETSCTASLLWRSLTLREVTAAGRARAELLPLLACYLESETDGGLQNKAAEVLDVYTTADADKLRLKLASGRHPNAVVVAQALKQLDKRKQKLPAEELLVLCQHHRKQVRDAARELNTVQGGKEPGPFDPAKAMQSPPLKAVLAELQKWTPDVLPAKNAEPVAVTVRYVNDEKKERKKKTFIGWLIEKKGCTVRLLLPGGSVDEFTHGEKGSLHVFATSSTPVTSEVSTVPADVEALVVAVAAARKRAARQAEDRVESPGLSRAEVFTGVWLMQSGRAVEAATLLLPALDTHDSDQYLLEFTRQEIGSIVGDRMMLAFGGSRDYTETLNIARRADTAYRNTKHHSLARRLLSELPKRADDWKTFTLPTPEEWKTLKAKLSRDEQLDYLASRLRLIRMLPGYETRVVPQEAQFADAEGKVPLVNPYSELVGSGPLWFRSDIPAVQGMNLTVKDVPALAGHLKSDWLTLCAGFTRFNDSRSTRGLLTNVINHLADHDLCVIDFRNDGRWDKLKPKEIDAEIERITEWAHAHESLSAVDLQWALYRQESKNAESFADVAKRVEKLLSHTSLAQERRTEVFEAMARFYRQTKSTWERQRILEAFRDFEPKAGLEFAEACLKEQWKATQKDRGRSLRFIAAQIVFAAGDKGKVRTLIGEELATGELDGRFNVWEPAVKLLLAGC